MGKVIDLTGKKFGDLIVIGRASPPPGILNTANYAYWKCKTSIGEIKTVRSSHLISGTITGRYATNGKYRIAHFVKNAYWLKKLDLRTYNSWKAVIERCMCPLHHRYSYYGGRGIKFHKPWLNAKVFYNYMGKRPLNTTIDRINVNGNYEPGNVRWADIYTQATNKRTKIAS